MRGKIFTACMLGGMIGAFTLHQVWYPSVLSILLGFIVGGFVSYLTYEFREVVDALKTAYKFAIGWHPDKQWWTDYLKMVPAVTTLFSTVAMGFQIFLFLPLYLADPTGNILSYIPLSGGIWAMVIICSPLIAGALMQETNQNKTLCRSLFRLNPVRVYCYLLPEYTIIGSLEILKGIMKAFPAIGRFIKYFFILIHSDIRLLCLLDGGLGAVASVIIISTPLGMLVGGFVGGILGVLNFEIISKRILHLVPLVPSK